MTKAALIAIVLFDVLIAGCRATGGIPVKHQQKVPVANKSVDQEVLVSGPVDQLVQPVALQLPTPFDSVSGDPPDTTDTHLLSLEEAIALALERNPNLATVRASEPVAHAAFHVAETYPWNPQFQTQVLPYSRDRNGNHGAVSQQHVIVQTFELGGQQGYREGAAAATWRQVSGTVRQAELTTAAQTTGLYFAALYQRELRDLNQTLAEANEQLVGVMQRRQQAGIAGSSDVELARLQAQSSRRQQSLAEANYWTAAAALWTQLNLDLHAGLELDRDWSNWQWRSLEDIIETSTTSLSLQQAGDLELNGGSALTQPENEAALRELLSGRPDIVAARAGVTAARQNLGFARAMRCPNVQTGPMWQRDETATVFWGVQAQMDIPIVNTGKTLVAQRCAELRQQQITVEQLEDQAVLDARAAMARYERSRLLVEASRGEFSGSIADSLKPFEDQFKAGQIEVLQVFAGRAAITQSRQSFLGLLNELAQAAAGVTQATGLPPQLMVSERQPAPDAAEELPKP